MNKARLSLLATALLATGVAMAEAPPAGAHRGPDMERMAILLDLNDTQKTQVQQILEEKRQKFRETREQNRAAGTRPSREVMKQLREQAHQETLTKLQGVLTPEQIKKYEALRQPPHHFRKHGRKHDHDRKHESKPE